MLAIRWIGLNIGPVPMEFEKLIDNCIDSTDLKTAISDLLERKKTGQEMDKQPKIAVISDYIENELAGFTKMAPPTERAKPTLEKLNHLFREILST